ncbi:MAG: hypothetical protein ACRYFW_09445 [Janthinobacterium lividum]
MADTDSKEARLARIHRVREVQARLAQADEARARDKAAAEANLHDRIAGLAAEVAPRPSFATAAQLGAAAHFRERLHASATAAAARVQTAELQHERSRLVTRDALRDRLATEKLLDRARAEAALTEVRTAQDAAIGTGVRRVRHGPC